MLRRLRDMLYAMPLVYAMLYGYRRFATIDFSLRLYGSARPRMPDAYVTCATMLPYSARLRTYFAPPRLLSADTRYHYTRHEYDTAMPVLH